MAWIRVLLCFGLVSPLAQAETLYLKTGEIHSDEIFRTDALFRRKIEPNIKNDEPLDQNYFVIVYFKITEKSLEYLAHHGVEKINYLPDHALLVRIHEPHQIKAMELDKNVRAILPYSDDWRISPDLSQVEDGLILLDVKLLSGEDSEAFEVFLKSQNFSFQSSSKDSFVVFAPKSFVPHLGANSMVEWVEARPQFQLQFLPLNGLPTKSPTSGLNGFESGTRLMGFEKAWERGHTGRGQMVALADTGVDKGSLVDIHLDLVNVVKGFGLARFDHSWMDTLGHGTHVAGSIGGRGQHEQLIKGGAFDAQLVVQSVMGEHGFLRVPGASQLIQPIYDLGVRIHSNSWGARRTSYDASAAEFDAFIWHNPDMLVLFSAGNSGLDSDRNGVVDGNSVGTPGTAKNVLSVGASENLVTDGGFQMTLGSFSNEMFPVPPLSSDYFSDNPKGIAGFSSRGPTDDGRRKPDVVAPGTNILSTRSRMGQSEMWGLFNEHYVFSGGTSMATPLTAGAVAVVRGALAKMGMNEPSAALLKGIIMHTAEDLFPGQFGTGQFQEIPTPRPNHVEGFGRVNMDRATRISSANLIDDKIGVGHGENKVYKIEIREPTRIMVTLNYTDAPSLVSSSKALVNDLDMELITPSGNSIRVRDRLNNNEYIEQQMSESGVYRIVIHGERVVKTHNGKQPFAVIVSGVFTN